MTKFGTEQYQALQSPATKEATRFGVVANAGLHGDTSKVMDNSIAPAFARRKGLARYCHASLIFGGVP